MQFALGPPVTTCQPQDFLPALNSLITAFYSSHMLPSTLREDQHPLDSFGVSGGQHRLLSQTLLTLRALLGQDVAVKSVAHPDLPAPRQLEPLGRRPFGFEFHCLSPETLNAYF